MRTATKYTTKGQSGTDPDCIGDVGTFYLPIHSPGVNVKAIHLHWEEVMNFTINLLLR
jgi:hypothetical protein